MPYAISIHNLEYEVQKRHLCLVGKDVFALSLFVSQAFLLLLLAIFCHQAVSEPGRKNRSLSYPFLPSPILLPVSRQDRDACAVWSGKRPNEIICVENNAQYRLAKK